MIYSDWPEYQPSDRDVLYNFNSNGFRGSEFDSSALLRLFVCGCSYTFGMGVAQDETWSQLILSALGERYGIAPSDRNLQNFAQIGGSNRYVARTIIEQCALVRPDLAIVMFTHRNRMEYLDGERVRNIGSWNLEPAAPDSPGVRFFEQYNDNLGSFDLLRNMRLVQNFFQLRGIPYFFAWVDIDEFAALRRSNISVIREIANEIDINRLARVSIKQRGIKVDVVLGHPGQESHRRFAAELLRDFESSSTAGDFDRVLRARAHARKVQKATDELLPRLLPRLISGLGRAVRSGQKMCARFRLRRKPSAIEAPHTITGHVSTGSTLRAVKRICSTHPKIMGLCVEWPLRGSIDHFINNSHICLGQNIESCDRPVTELAALANAFYTPEIRLADSLIDVLTAQYVAQLAGISYEFRLPAGTLLLLSSNRALRSLASTLDVHFIGKPMKRSARAAAARAPGGYRGRSDAEVLKKYCRSSACKEDPNIYPLW